MPIITVEGPPLAAGDKKRELVRELTQAAARAFALPPATIVVLLKANAPDNVAVGGQLLSERKPPAP